jgi:hypothetical protein
MAFEPTRRASGSRTAGSGRVRTAASGACGRKTMTSFDRSSAMSLSGFSASISRTPRVVNHETGAQIGKAEEFTLDGGHLF